MGWVVICFSRTERLRVFHGVKTICLSFGLCAVVWMSGCDSATESLTGSTSRPGAVGNFEAAPTALAGAVLGQIAPSATINGALLVSRRTGTTNDPDNAGNNASGTQDWPSISGDGNVIVFDSMADNLVDGDNFGKRDIFLRKLSDDTTVRIMGFGGAEPNGDSFKPKVSRDGRYVCFESVATNLIENDTNGDTRDIFRYDNVTGEVIVVSVDNDGAQFAPGSGFSTQSSISGDGQRIAFSAFGNLTGAGAGIHVRDLRAYPPRTLRPAIAGGGHGERPVISADGGHVAFWSSNTVLPSDVDEGAKVADPNANPSEPENRRFFDSRIQAYVYHLPFSTTKAGSGQPPRTYGPEGETTRISVNKQGERANDESSHPSISEDGRYVAFWSEATNLVSEPNPPHRRNIFWHDTLLKTNKCVSLRGDRMPAQNGDTTACRISANGQFVAFSSVADDLRGAGPGQQFYVCALLTSDLKTTLASEFAAIPPATGSLYAGGGLGDLSDDGKRISFIAGETLLSGVTGTQVYVRGNPALVEAPPAPPASTTLVSTDSEGQVPTDGRVDTVDPRGGPNSNAAALSYDGRYIAFVHGGPTLLVPEEVPLHLESLSPLPMESRQVYLKDRTDGSITLVSPPPDAERSLVSTNLYPAISADGKAVAFASDQDGWNYQVLVYNADTRDRELISQNGLPNGSSLNPSLSSDGRYVAFESTGQWDGDTDPESDIFVWDRTESEMQLISADGPASAQYYSPKISGNGRYVAFLFSMPGDGFTGYGVLVKDRWELSGSVQAFVSQPNAVDMSDDGRYVVYDSNGSIYVMDRGATPGSQSPTTDVVVSPSTKRPGNGYSSNPRISGNGRFVVFDSMATNFVSPDRNGTKQDVYAYNVITKAIQRLSVNSANVQPNNVGAATPAISGDGKCATFVGYDSNVYVPAPPSYGPGQLFIKGVAL